MLNSKLFSERVHGVPRSEIRAILNMEAKYDFSGGRPIIPDELKKLSLKLEKKDFQYGNSQGSADLREIFSNFLGLEGLKVSLDDILITTGSQQTLFLIANLFLNKGDLVATTLPIYLGMLGPINMFGGKVLKIESDEKGMIPESLEKGLEVAKGKVKFIYIIPDSDNPTGKTLSLKRREKIFNIASQYEIPILEDAAYREIQFREKLPPIKFFDKENEIVIYTRTTSKELAPIRVGYTIIPKWIFDAILKFKEYIDLCTPFLTQKFALVYYSNLINKVLPKIVEEYKRRRDEMVKALKEVNLGKFVIPTGGFFIWLTLYKNINTKDLLERILKESYDKRVKFVPGAGFYPQSWVELNGKELKEANNIPKNQMRLCYSYSSEISEGIKLLAQHINSF